MEKIQYYHSIGEAPNANMMRVLYFNALRVLCKSTNVIKAWQPICSFVSEETHVGGK